MVACFFHVLFVELWVEVFEDGVHGVSLVRVLHAEVEDGASSLCVGSFSGKERGGKGEFPGFLFARCAFAFAAFCLACAREAWARKLGNARKAR